MKKYFTLIAFVLGSCIVQGQTLNTFHDFDAIKINGDTISLSQYAGKKLMVVNTASYCGFTPQFTDLEQLYTQYNQYNFEILGFPCNDFGGQDPGTDNDIYQFCTNNYNVTFQMMKKVFVIDSVTSPIYDWLQQGVLNGVQNAPVAWNFNKFLIDETGHWVAHYPSATLPNDPAIVNWILSSVTSVATVDNNQVEFLSGNTNNQNISLRFKANAKAPINISLWGMDGKCVSSNNYSSIKQSEVVNYNTDNLQQGIYLVKVEGNTFNQTFKYCVVK